MALHRCPSAPGRGAPGVAVVLLAALTALASCSGSPSAVPSRTPTPTISAAPSPEPPPPPIAPLTGLVAISEERTRRPVLAIKIDNHTAARPHAGLDRADIVYEEPVEGGITRFIAIYQSRNAAPVGPIRSARLTDIDVLAEYGRAILAFSGAAGYVLRALPKARLVTLPHGAYGSIYRRSPGRRAPHNLFSDVTSLYRAARGRKASAARAPFIFGELLEPPAPASATSTPSASGSPSPSGPAWPRGRSVRIPFAGSAWTAVWRYHAATGLYRRWHGSSPHRVTGGKQVTAANVLVMRVRTRSSNAAAAARGTPQLVLTGSGPAVLLRDGARIRGTWTRAALTKPTVFRDVRSRRFVLKPGSTWIELVPKRIAPRYT